MHRKPKLDQPAAGDNSANGTRSKEAALDKLRQMEWMRNKEDTWHLSRSNSRSGDGVHERKKYNKEEDYYFEGTSVQKNKKGRRPRVSEDSPNILPRLSVTHVPAAPPPVNAWTQKKGSALFRVENEVDEEDEMLKLVLEESLKTAEQDRKRHLERLRMVNLPLSTQTVCAEKDWEEEYPVKDFTNSPSGFDQDSPKSELHFVDTEIDETAPQSQRRKPAPVRNFKKSSPHEKSTSHSSNNNIDPPQQQKTLPSPPVNCNIHLKNKTDDFFEPSRPIDKYSKPVMNDDIYETSQSLPCMASTSMPQQPSMKDANAPSVNDLSTSFKSSLTFGDTQGLFEEFQDNNAYKPSCVDRSFKNDSPDYLHRDSDNAVQMKPTLNGPSETDIMLHSFIRHEPPPNANLVNPNIINAASITKSESDDLFSMPSSQSFTPHNLESSQPFTSYETADSNEHSLLNGLAFGIPRASGIHIPNGRDSSSSLSGSPLQNVTPYGSLEKQMPSNVGVGQQTPPLSGHVPYTFPFGVQNGQESLNPNLQAFQIMSQNPTTQINAEYALSSAIRGMVPMNPQIGVAPLRLPNSNIILPPFQSQDLRNISPQVYQLQQAQLQAQFQHMLASNPLRLNQQAQHTVNVSEGDENTDKEQINVTNQSQIQGHQQILAQNQPQVLMQSQPHVMQLHNQQAFLPQNHPQAIPTMETGTPKQDVFLQQTTPQCSGTPPKTQEEIYMEYQKHLLALNKLHQELHQVGVQIQPSPQPQPGWGVYSANPSVPLGMNQFFPGVPLMPQVHPHLIQQSQSMGHVSPTLQQSHSILTGSVNAPPEINSEMETAQELVQVAEPKIGRGRGRIH